MVAKFGGVELAFDARAELGEGPVWDPVEQQLVWIDAPRRTVHWFGLQGVETAIAEVPNTPGSVALRRSGGLVMALEDGFWLLEPDLRTLRQRTPLPMTRPGIRMNDGKCHADGSFWAGSVSADLSPTGVLWRLASDGQLGAVLAGVRLSNGMGWSPDGKIFYFIDSPLFRVDAFDYEPAMARISGRRTVVEVPRSDGMPDGMTVDAEGYIWLALWGGSAVRRYAPDGRLDQSLPLPVSNVTSCAFGGRDLTDLYVTTASDGLSHGELLKQPLAGGLFVCRGVGTGMPSPAFDG